MAGLQARQTGAVLLLLVSIAYAYMQCPPQWTAGYPRCFRLSDSVVTSASELDALCDTTFTGSRVAVISNLLDYPAASSTLLNGGATAYVGAASIGQGTAIWADGTIVPAGIQDTSFAALQAQNAAWGTGSMIGKPISAEHQAALARFCPFHRLTIPPPLGSCRPRIILHAS
jgi:hypothetical protein